MTGHDLYRRGANTLLASWDAIARGARGAAVRRSPGVAAAVFPRGPERAVYNNALLERGLGPRARAAALDAMEAAYGAASVGRFAAWVHESDAALRDDVLARGYILDTSTRAMAMALDEVRLPRPDVDLGPAAEWAEYVRYLEAVGGPPGLLAGVDPDRFHLRIARLDGETAATALAFDHDGDRGIYNVSTVARARRRGLATALAGVLLHDAAARGCRTASLQATEPAEGIYRTLGFRDLGRFLEFVPGLSDGALRLERRDTEDASRGPAAPPGVGAGRSATAQAGHPVLQGPSFVARPLHCGAPPPSFHA